MKSLFSQSSVIAMHSSKYLCYRYKSCGLTNFLGYVSQQNAFATSIDLDIPTKPNKSTTTSKTKEASNKKVKSERKNHAKDILEYFATRPTDSVHNISELPKKILQRHRKPPDALYIVDKDVAKQLVTTIKPHLLRGNCPIFEGNPGTGLVSEELLRAGAPHLHLYEPNSTFNSGRHLHELIMKYPGRVDLNTIDLFLIYKLAFYDKLDGGTRVKKIMSDVTRRQWKDGPAMKIVGALPNVIFLKHLIMSFVYQNGIMMYGRPEMYLVMTPPLYIHLTCDGSAGYLHYRATTVLFQLIFKLEMLAKLPRKAYFPWEMEYTAVLRSKLTKVLEVDPEFVYLVKIEPREDFFESVVPADKLQELRFFIQHNLLSRRNQVIPQLEKWIPGCGPRLIMGGLSIYTQFGDLSPKEILAVFREFTSWPEYPHCTFLPSMETNFLKSETLSSDLDKEIDENQAEENEGMEEEDISPNL